MKIILSRKGTDSAAGGMPSIILPNGRIVHFPIPGDEYEEIAYDDIKYDNSIGSLADLIGKLSKYIRCNKTKYLINSDTKCHFDPDLKSDIYPRHSDWRGCFGQIGAAQTVLTNSNIEKGDIFLFFGWFNKTYYDNGVLKYCKDDGFHMIYGWLQIDEIIYTERMPIPEWLQYHPHVNEKKVNDPRNCIYVGSPNLSWDRNVYGYGVFEKFDESLVLTKNGMSRSKWELPDLFKDVSITYHSEKSWKDTYFQSAFRGQEFVCQEDKKVEEWAKGIISRNVFIG